MPLAQKYHAAVDVFAGRLEDKQIHYGLIFALPDSRAHTDCSSARKFSDLDTHSRHGAIEDWHLGRPLESLPPGQAVLLIPRTWLIRQGYLPWAVLFLPYRFFAVRRPDEFQRHFWLEWPDGDSVTDDDSITDSDTLLKAA